MFPEKSRFLKRPIGWKDLGKQRRLTIGEGKTTVDVCTNCNNILNIGTEKGEPFKYCKRCLIKFK